MNQCKPDFRREYATFFRWKSFIVLGRQFFFPCNTILLVTSDIAGGNCYAFWVASLWNNTRDLTKHLWNDRTGVERLVGSTPMGASQLRRKRVVEWLRVHVNYSTNGHRCIQTVRNRESMFSLPGKEFISTTKYFLVNFPQNYHR